MNNIHKFIMIRDDGSKVMHVSQPVTCTEVADSVYYYLLGCGFQKESVLDALAQIVSEHERDFDVK